MPAYSSILDAWDNPPFVETLKAAYDSDAGSGAISHLRHLGAEETPMNKPLQRVAEKEIRQNLIASFSWASLFARRIPKVFNCGGTLTPQKMASFIGSLRRCRPLVVQSVLATVLNGWHTSHRMHERTRLMCPFCMLGPDKLCHIVECSRLFHIVFDLAVEHLHAQPSRNSPNLTDCFHVAIADERFELFYMCCFLYRHIFNALKFEKRFSRIRIAVQESSSEDSDSDNSSDSPSSSTLSASSSSAPDNIVLQPLLEEVSMAVPNVGRAALLLLV